MKAILPYLLLAGLPVLGILGLLQIGKNLKPPASVGGIWNLEIESLIENNPSCADHFTWPEQATLTISQSGPHLRLTLNDEAKSTLAGRIDDLRITATTSLKQSHTTGRIHLQASVERQSEPHRLLGTVTIGNCSPPLSLTAERLPVPHGTSGGH